MNEDYLLPSQTSIDPVGIAKFTHNKVIRVISSQMQEHTQELLNSGLLDELAQKGFIPQTTAHSDAQGTLTVEQIRIQNLTYPSEWSFSMVKAAALHTFAVEQICRNYGYTIKDFHLWNIVFSGTSPLFVDFGSIQKITNADDARAARHLAEFLNDVYEPLQLWAQGKFYIANRILADEVGKMRLAPSPVPKPPLRLAILHFIGRVKHFASRKIPSLQSFLQWVPDVTMDTLRQSILPLKSKKNHSLWNNYHAEYLHGGALQSTPRFDKINEIVATLPVESLVDIAGNSGVFSLICARRNSKLKHIVCADYDSNAVEALYQHLQTAAHPRDHIITPLLFNVIFPMATSDFLPCHTRIKGDIVAALAVSHHILLSQGIPIATFFSRIRRHATKYVLIEFMPLGLFDGTNAPPVPEWYTEKWFEEHFSQHFMLIHKERLEINRVMFLGEVRKDSKD